MMCSLPVCRGQVPPNPSLYLAVGAGVPALVGWQINQVQAHLISCRACSTLDVAKASRGAFHVVHQICQDEPGNDSIQGGQVCTLRLVQQIKGGCSPRTGAGGSVLSGQEVEARWEFLVPEESAGSTEAEDKSYRGKVDLFALSQLCVQIVNHSLRCWMMNQVHDVEICMIKIVLEERQSVLLTRDIYAS